MLAALSIRDVVLIDRLDIDFDAGLTVLTGETGAGKSIVLDALALALGARGDAGLVRHGAAQGSVTATFSNDAATTRIHPLLEERGIAASGDVVLRRVQHGDGRTRAFVNDEPVSGAFLRAIGQALVEIHGQHDERALLDPAAHLALIDAFAGHDGALAEVAGRWRAWREAEAALEAFEADMARALADADYLRHAAEELGGLQPEPGEETRLASEREVMMAGEQIAEQLAAAVAALSDEGGAETALSRALAALGRARDRAPGLLHPVIDALARGQAEVEEAVRGLGLAQREAEYDPARLEAVEERLFALRAAARKHAVSVDDLPALAGKLIERLTAIEDGEDRLAALKAARERDRQAYGVAADELSKGRKAAAARIGAEVVQELAPLKLEAARFEAVVEAQPLERAGPGGRDRAEFMISTNPGTPLGALRRVASGGELTRVMLALKVVLAGRGGAPTLIFDEIDSGVGGAVADAVGERLGRLGREVQVLVVTHSPQVAARGTNHFVIAKSAVSTDGEARSRTTVGAVAQEARRDEIARMLSGARVTEEARAAADRLIAGALP